MRTATSAGNEGQAKAMMFISKSEIHGTFCGPLWILLRLGSRNPTIFNDQNTPV
jgi:hypothetical protein